MTIIEFSITWVTIKHFATKTPFLISLTVLPSIGMVRCFYNVCVYIIILVFYYVYRSHVSARGFSLTSNSRSVPILFSNLCLPSQNCFALLHLPVDLFPALECNSVPNTNFFTTLPLYFLHYFSGLLPGTLR